jgi:flagellar biosynthesis protein FlhF
MRDALERVKHELGPDAVILGTRSVAASGLDALTGRQQVEITAAPPDATPTQRRAATPSVRAAVQAVRPAAAAPKRAFPVDEHLYPYYVRLVQNEVAEEVAAEVLRRAGAQLSGNASGDEAALRNALRDFIAQQIPVAGGIQLTDGGCKRVALVGPAGSGKTSLSAKLAAHFRLREKRNVALLSLDNGRVGATDQLRHYADAIGVSLYTAQSISEVKTCLRGLEGVDLLLIDTLGVGMREQARFARLATLLRAARPEETHLVLPASLMPAAQERIARSFAMLGVDRVVFTRLDEVAGFGVILNVVNRLQLGMSYLSHGQNVPHDIEIPCGTRLAELLLLSDE